MHGTLLVYFEAERKLRRAAPPTIIDYLTHRGRGEYCDLYIFDDSMHWCIAYTAEDDNGADVVLLTGQTKAFGL